MRTLTVLCLVAVGFGLLSCSTEPTYKGRTLRQWLAVYDNADEGGPEEQKAIAAVRGMGTNAIPYLIKWITDDDWRVYQPAVNMFKALGPEAATAVPDLGRMLMGTNELIA